VSDAAPFVVCRADGGPGIGGGHLARMAALADSFRRVGGRVALATRGGAAPGFDATLTLAGPVADEPATLARRWPGGADLLVVDHYGRDAAFEAACRPWARRILAVDDLAGRAHASDAVLQVAPPAGPPPAWPGALALTGADYALLRRDFARARPTLKRAPEKPVARVLVAMGAVDTADATARALAALAEAAYRGAVGRQAPHRARVAAALDRLPFRATLHIDADMPALIAAADLGLGAGGVGAFERACLGLPGVILPVAENQRPSAALLAEAGAACVTEADPAPTLKRLLADADERRALSAASFAIVDGLGTERVRVALAPPILAGGRAVTLRPARAADVEAVFAWQRDPATRRHFRNPAPPTPAEHAAWFAAVRADPARRLMIVEHGGAPAGTLRLDWHEREAGVDAYEISVAIAPDRMGQGIGGAALAGARALLPAARFVAAIRPGNAASLALFARAGYGPAGDGTHVSRPLRAEETP
jgi:UDP-2,4-diacetamido-2,4,6-trideoxy-beta-L-altropyranose hydrolase